MCTLNTEQSYETVYIMCRVLSLYYCTNSGGQHLLLNAHIRQLIWGLHLHMTHKQWTNKVVRNSLTPSHVMSINTCNLIFWEYLLRTIWFWTLNDKTVRYAFMQDHAVSYYHKWGITLHGTVCILHVIILCCLWLSVPRCLCCGSTVAPQTPQWPSYRSSPVTLFVALLVVIFNYLSVNPTE